MIITLPLQGTLYTNPDGYQWAPEEDPVMYSEMLRELYGPGEMGVTSVVTTDVLNGTVEVEIEDNRVAGLVVAAIAQREPHALRQAMGRTFVHEQLDLPGNAKLFRFYHDRTKGVNNVG